MKIGHYDNIEEKIKNFYMSSNNHIEIEPHGSRGPDIKGRNDIGEIIIGEIKGAKEITRDLGGYWGQWNSDRSFGGKTTDYKLGDNYSDKGLSLHSSAIKGWVSVIDGQLRGYCFQANCTSGDLVIENYENFENDIYDAVNYLKFEKRISKVLIYTDKYGIGYITLTFLY